MTEKTLIVSKGRDRFEFFFDGENRRYWVVRDHPDFPDYFLIEVFEDDLYIDDFGMSYEEFDVNDLWELYELLIREPGKTLEKIFGKKFEIERIIVEE